MSAEATAYVWGHSPYKDRTFLVHLALADIANDLHGNELWCSITTVSEKCRSSRQRVSKAFTDLVDDGFLEMVQDNSHLVGKPSRYRFLFPPVDKSWNARSPVSPQVTPVSTGVTPRVNSGDTHASTGVTLTKETQVNEKVLGPDSNLPVEKLVTDDGEWLNPETGKWEDADEQDSGNGTQAQEAVRPS